jgi:GH35 family endo-1,4-beta-xylanase
MVKKNAGGLLFLYLSVYKGVGMLNTVTVDNMDNMKNIGNTGKRISTMAWVFVFILSLTLHWAHAEQIFASDFEQNGAGWSLYVKTDGDATGSGTANLQSEQAAFTGAKGARVQVTQTSTENWHVQLQLAPNAWAPQAGGLYKISMQARGPASIHMGIGDIGHNYLLGANIALTSEWQLFSTIIKAPVTPLRLSLYLANATGNYDIDDFTIEALPPLDTTWYTHAQARIDSLRKGTASVMVLANSQGANPNPNVVAGVGVRFTLQQHAFPFGTALNFEAVKHRGTQAFTTYKEKAAEYFWAGVTENAFKWPSYEPSQGTTHQALIHEYLDWTEQQNWSLMRGHAFVWGIEQYGYDTHWPRLGTCEELRESIKTRITRDATAFAGRFHQYDVWNEIFHEPSLFERCGWELLDSAFVWAHKADPQAKLFLNEYNVVSGGSTDTYYQHAKRLLDNNIPLHGLGVQGHFWDTEIDPALIKMRLDRLAQLGLPIVITEYDVGTMTEGVGTTQAQELEQAQKHATLIRSAFSHPAVHGIILWGFWDNQHWIPNGGIFRADWSAKPAADTIAYLWKTLWTTDTVVYTNAQGIAQVPAYYGQYTYSVGDGSTSGTLEVGPTPTTQSAIYEGPVGILPHSMRTPTNQPVKVYVYNVHGEQKTVWLPHSHVTDLTTAIQGLHLPAGVYFIKLHDPKLLAPSSRSLTTLVIQ